MASGKRSWTDCGAAASRTFANFRTAGLVLRTGAVRRDLQLVQCRSLRGRVPTCGRCLHPLGQPSLLADSRLASECGDELA